MLYRKGEEKTKLCLPLRGPAKVIKVAESGGAVVLEWTDLATGVTHVLDRNIRYVFPMKEGDKGLENLPVEKIKETQRIMQANQVKIVERYWYELVSRRKKVLTIPPLYRVVMADKRVVQLKECEVKEELLYLQRKGIQERYFPDAGPDKQKALLHLQQLRDVSLVEEVEPQSKRPR